jgi:methylase of polypeptide subunit release factors
MKSTQRTPTAADNDFPDCQDLREQDVERRNQLFFVDKRQEGVTGTAETPHDVVLAMIRESIAAFGADSAQGIRWLDPCSGTGAFVLGLIDTYSSKAEIRSYDDLPNITLVEIDHQALELQKERLDAQLSRHGLDFSGYLKSGRLQVINEDFFSFVHANLTLSSISQHFDVIIGNPPYLKSRHIPTSTIEAIKSVTSKTFSKSADLYAHFYIGAWKLLTDGGVLSFITPHNFLKSPSCRRIRIQMAINAHLHSIIDFGERPIFKQINVHTGVFTFQKGQGSTGTKFVDLAKQIGPFVASELENHKHQVVQLTQSSDAKWIISALDSHGPALSKDFRTLDDHGYQVFSGIRTGLTEAYILDSQLVERLSLKGDSSLYPIVSAKDLGHDYLSRPSHWIINLPRGCEMPSDKILKHLETYREKLSSRAESPTLNYWYEQRSITYLDKMKERKIVFPDIGISPTFSIVEENVLIADGAYFIDSDDLALLALLRSNFAREYFQSHSPTIGSVSARGRLRLKKHVVRGFPMPPDWAPDSTFATRLRDLMLKIISESSTASSTWEVINQVIEEQYTHGNVSI